MWAEASLLIRLRRFLTAFLGLELFTLGVGGDLIFLRIVSEAVLLDKTSLLEGLAIHLRKQFLG